MLIQIKKRKLKILNVYKQLKKNKISWTSYCIVIANVSWYSVKVSSLYDYFVLNQVYQKNKINFVEIRCFVN